MSVVAYLGTMRFLLGAHTSYNKYLIFFFGENTSYTPISDYIDPLGSISERARNGIYWARADFNFCAVWPL